MGGMATKVLTGAEVRSLSVRSDRRGAARLGLHLSLIGGAGWLVAASSPWTLLPAMLLLGVAMLSSKGAAGVTGAGFITLAATLAIVPAVPVAGLALILGVDRFMSECRSLTNFIGNAVATIVVARWEGALDRERLAAALGGRGQPA